MTDPADVQAGQAFYDEAWRGWGPMTDHSPAPIHRRRWILKVLRKIQDSIGSVADVGCGNGRLIADMDRLWGDRKALTGFDISASVTRQNEERFFEKKHISWGVACLPEDRLPMTYDAIVASELLEHIDDWRAAFQRLLEAARKYLIVTVPAGKIFPIDRRVGHFRHFTREMFEPCLSGRPVRWRAHYWGFPFHMLYKRLINLRPEGTYERFASGAYSPLKRFIAAAVSGLFFLNVPVPFGTSQLFLIVEKKSGPAPSGRTS